MADLLQGHESTVASLYVLTSRATSFLGPIIIASIVQSTGRFDFAWLFFAIATLGTLPLFNSIDVEKGLREAKEFNENEIECEDDAGGSTSVEIRREDQI